MTVYWLVYQFMKLYRRSFVFANSYYSRAIALAHKFVFSKSLKVFDIVRRVYIKVYQHMKLHILGFVSAVVLLQEFCSCVCLFFNSYAQYVSA